MQRFQSDDQMFWMNQIITLKEVMEYTCLGRSILYETLNPKSNRYDATFPKLIKLSLNSVGWSTFEVNQWIDSRLASRK